MKTAEWILVCSVAFMLGGCLDAFPSFPKLAADPAPSQFSSLVLTGEFSGEAHAQDDLGNIPEVNYSQISIAVSSDAMADHELTIPVASPK